MLLSIITISYKNPDLANTLNSVLKQRYNSKDFEHIIVEGFPENINNKIVLDYQKKAKYKVTYICENDTGRYNAMNKGIKTATGEYLLFLNAGDNLYDQSTLSKVLINEETTDILYGDILMSNNRKERKLWSLAKHTIDSRFFVERSLFHQACFIKKNLFEKYGLYDESYKLCADFDFFIKTIIKYHATTKYLPFIIAIYDANGASSQLSDLLLA